MSPIVTTAGGPAQAVRRGRVPVVQSVSWDRPNGGVGVLGPGEFAPAWSGKTVYGDNSPFPLPNFSESANADGSTYFTTAGSARFLEGDEFQCYAHPTIETPLGTQTVLRTIYPGSTHTISAVDEVTATRRGNYAWSVKVSGTWVGTLVFEKSDNDGASWEAIQLERLNSNASYNGTLESSTTANGGWTTGNASQVQSGRTFRVRASAWTSGTATIDIGMKGGVGATAGRFGNFTGDPTRIYMRFLVRHGPGYTTNGNNNIKHVFFSKEQGNNHVLFWGADTPNNNVPRGICVPQAAPGTQGIYGSSLPQFDLRDWTDVEYELHAGTAGNFDSISRCWINGVQSLNDIDGRFFAAGAIPRFRDFSWDNTYGGGFFPPPANVYYDIAAWYWESAP